MTEETNDAMVVKCSCGCFYSLHYHTLCPGCLTMPDWVGEQEKPKPEEGNGEL